MPGEPRRPACSTRRRFGVAAIPRIAIGPYLQCSTYFLAIIDRQSGLVFGAGLLDSLGGLVTADFFVRNWLTSNLRNVSRISTMGGIKVCPMNWHASRFLFKVHEKC
jgi:hypothetical protein